MKIELSNALGRVFLTIAYDAENHWVHNNWLGYQTLETVMQGANVCIDILEKYKCPYLLNDNRLVAGPWHQAAEWIAQDWTPRAIATGLIYFAHVVSPEYLARLSAENLNNKISGSFNMQIFVDYEDAKNWLLQAQRGTPA